MLAGDAFRSVAGLDGIFAFGINCRSCGVFCRSGFFGRSDFGIFAGDGQFLTDLQTAGRLLIEIVDRHERRKTHAEFAGDAFRGVAGLDDINSAGRGSFTTFDSCFFASFSGNRRFDTSGRNHIGHRFKDGRIDLFLIFFSSRSFPGSGSLVYIRRGFNYRSGVVHRRGNNGFGSGYFGGRTAAEEHRGTGGDKKGTFTHFEFLLLYKFFLLKISTFFDFNEI